MSNERPLPIISDENRPYWDAAKDHRLLMPICESCGRIFFPLAPVCPDCFSDRIGWRQVSGRGRVSSFVVFHKAFFPYHRDKVPYAVVQVELEEGPRVNGNLFDMAIKDIHIGMGVETVFERVDEEITLPQFRPATGGKKGAKGA